MRFLLVEVPHATEQVADVRCSFIDLLSPAELDMFAALNERILHHLAEDGGSTDEQPSDG